MSDRGQDLIFIVIAIIVSLIYFGVPILNMAGVSLDDIINNIKQE